MHSRLCTQALASALSNCALIVNCTPSSRLHALALSVLSPLHSYSVRSHCALIVHCTPSSRLCALALSVLSSCTLLPPLDSVPLRSLYSQLCTLHSALCTLDSAFSHSLRSRPFTLESVLSTLHYRSLHSDSAFSHSLYSRLCILVVWTLTLHSHTPCTLDSTFSWSGL